MVGESIILGATVLSLVLSWFAFRPPDPKIVAVKDGKIVWNYDQA